MNNVLSLTKEFSYTSGLVLFALAVIALLILRRVRSHRVLSMGVGEKPSYIQRDSEIASGHHVNEGQVGQTQGTTTGLARTSRAVPANGSSRNGKPVVRQPVTTPASQYGAYRIDQEVGKLVLGQTHRMDVLASRASEDRRAIETSLIKVVASTQSEDRERRRAREALEEYGFVARQCAALLLAPDAFERTSAARSLGEMGSPSSLPFLLEGLYDFEMSVRNQSVISIGQLKVPSAIGALLDMARKHPDVPSSVITRALSACSGVEATVQQGSLLSTGLDEGCVLDISRLEPTTSVEDLPEGLHDEGLSKALSELTSLNQEERSEAVNRLAQYGAQSSVAALASVARNDSEPSVRSLAISSLAAINHESVFAAVLIGLADESREVRAAAARSLNRLSFDRSEAYVRVIETSSEETLRDVADACIKAGIVSQNIDRLASRDHRQAYEAFSLMCLLAKARMTQPVLETICNHPNMNVRLSAIHLLATTGQPEMIEQLRELALKPGVPDEVNTALLEAMYKLEQISPGSEDPALGFIVSESDSEPERLAGEIDELSFEKFDEQVDKVEL